MYAVQRQLNPLQMHGIKGRKYKCRKGIKAIVRNGSRNTMATLLGMFFIPTFDYL